MHNGALYQGTASAVPPRYFKRERGFSPVMARPARNASPEGILCTTRTFFLTTKMAMGQRLLQSERNAELLIDVLRCYARAKKFEIHDFVIMPDHLHVLLTVRDEMTIEKAAQLIKGAFSFRIKKEFGYLGEVWQRGYSEVRVNDRGSHLKHREYIAQNPVEAGLASTPEEYPFCYMFLVRKKKSTDQRLG